MSDFVLQREIRSLQGDLNMNKMAVTSVQREMKEQLCGEMGEDITAVLNGKRIVKASVIERKKHKVKTWLKKIFNII